jgi:hypothetical protein
MALPSSGSISIDDIKTELGITGALDLTDSRVRTLAGVPSGSITLPNDFWGKSARTVTIAGQQTVSRLGQFGYLDQASLSIAVSDGTVPSSYLWSLVSDDPGFSSLPSPYNTATKVWRGPGYTLDNGFGSGFAVVQCAVVVGGVTYYPQRTLYYTYDNAA